MNQTSFRESLHYPEPPAGLSIQLRSLWYDVKGDWHTAHDLINNLTDPASAQVHAYLHRKEGDSSNARYWYSRAGKLPCHTSLKAEWEELVRLNTEK